MPEMKETKKRKDVALYEQAPKQFEPDPSPRNSLIFCTKSKKITLNQIKLKARIEGDVEHMFFCYMSRPKTYFEP